MIKSGDRKHSDPEHKQAHNYRDWAPTDHEYKQTGQMYSKKWNHSLPVNLSHIVLA